MEAIELDTCKKAHKNTTMANIHIYVCMYVCMYACMYECMYVRTYVRMYVCMHVCINQVLPDRKIQFVKGITKKNTLNLPCLYRAVWDHPVTESW